MSDEYSYGVMAYNSINIGDEIQSIAAMRFLPEIDEYVYREQINKFIPVTNKKTKLIMNAWWMWKPANFPPSKYIEPLLISMFIRTEIRKSFLPAREYLLNHGAVGCRDMNTLKWLESENIPAYFSGCLTLTLKRNPNIKREDYIVCVDTREELVNEIKKRTQRPVYRVSRMISPFYTAQQRFELAKMQLLLDQSAHLVVSSRLHVILPSLALETPVLRIMADEKEMGESSRYEGYENFFNTYTNEDIINNPDAYDFENPLKNPDLYIPVREKLIQTCKEFTGYDSNAPFIEDNVNPLVKYIQLNEYSMKNIKKVSFFAPKIVLIRTLLKRCAGYDKYDLLDDNKIASNFLGFFRKLFRKK